MSCCILRVSVAAVLLYNIVIQAFIFSGAVLITPGNLGHVTSAAQSHWHHVRSQPVTLQRAHRRKQTKKKRKKKKKIFKAFWTSASGWRAVEVTDHGGEAEVGKQLAD